MGRLDGRLAIVTGASRGIGLAIVTAFAREGARVVMASRKQEGLDAAAAQVRSEVPGAQVDPRALHVGKLDQIGAWMDAVQAAHGVPTVLINNAGTNPYFGPMLGVQDAAWDKTFEVNVKGPFALTREVVQRCLAMPTPPAASIVSVSSVLGQTAAPLQGVYGMTKASLISMTKTLAAELGQTGIRINAIAPGFVETRLSAAITTDEALSQQVVGRTPMGRIGQPDEIAGLAVYLASNESSFMTGQTLTIDGGMTIT